MPLFNLSLSQILLAFVSATILHRLTYRQFFLRWLASHKFVCFLAPTNNELKKHLGRKTKTSPKKKFHERKEDPKDEVFKLRAIDLHNVKLNAAVLTARDFQSLHYAIDLEWIVDLALMSIFCYVLTEIQFFAFPETQDTNFSLLWALLVVMYCFKTLWKLTGTYFRSEETIGERSICIVSGCLFLLTAMIVLIVSEQNLEFGLESAYRSFNQSATDFVKHNKLTPEKARPITRPVSFILVKFTIAVMCALVGVIFTFPGLKFGMLHKTLLDRSDTSLVQKIKYYINLMAPLFIVWLWVKPLARDLIKNQEFIEITDEAFDTFRIYCIISTSVLRFFLLPKYLACFLASGAKALKKIRNRGGSLTNRELQISISGIVGYANVASLQYVLPTLLCLFTALMLKSMGGLTWYPTNQITDYYGNATISDNSLEAESSLTNVTRPFSVLNMVDLTEFKKIFSPEVFKGTLGFAVWWFHFAWVCTSTAGVFYHTYLVTKD